jgi:asparagine synthase (glutamine-hydrolysing)
MDDPAADYACVPAFALAEQARAAGLKTVLSWEGAEELFAGYGRYRSLVRPWWLGGRAMRRRGIFEGLGVLREGTVGWRDGIAAAEATERVGGRSRLQVAQAVDCADWLSNDPLAKLDRCLMAHGIEGRTPFLDSAVATVAFRLPDRLKMRDRKGKWLLRKWLQQAVPQADAFARRRGTAMPVAAWIAEEGARLGPLVAAQPGVAELADPDAVVKLFRNPRKHEALAAWTLLFYALWHQLHVLGRTCEGDAFECLATTMERTAA